MIYKAYGLSNILLLKQLKQISQHTFINRNCFETNMAGFKRERTDNRQSRGRDGGSDRKSSFSQERSSGRFSARRDDRGSDRRSSRTEMHEVICDKCHKTCEVPFKPTSNKPIYCSDCFRKDDNRSAPRDNSSNSLDEINRKLDAIMKALKIN
ncbi:hypothetical protein COY27_00395 [Candidatus Woesearchaeota archaeon CG_4_10_14_0_2_um_filter_33_13]|nr:MAG: hypothetical protein COY27_00395 [Candidatus Woesearchaeota archaeon CG_4_10_14_0_2_um_filter_33_13]